MYVKELVQFRNEGDLKILRKRMSELINHSVNYNCLKTAPTKPGLVQTKK